MGLATIRKMDKYARIITNILEKLLIAIFVGGFILMLWHISFPFRLEYQIKIDTKEEQVFKIVGSNPREVFAPPAFCDQYKNNFGNDCAEIKHSGSLKLYEWDVGIDTVFVVGVNSSGRVSYVTFFDV